MQQIVTAYSEYEWDVENKRVRRVAGLNPPTRFIGEDGVWRDYLDYEVSFDGGLWFWNAEGRGFLTSPVARVTDISPEENRST